MSYMIRQDDVDRIATDARTAIDALNSILKESVQSRFCFAPYIKEKVNKAKSCIDFIESVTNGYLEGGKNE